MFFELLLWNSLLNPSFSSIKGKEFLIHCPYELYFNTKPAKEVPSRLWLFFFGTRFANKKKHFQGFTEAVAPDGGMRAKTLEALNINVCGGISKLFSLFLKSLRVNGHWNIQRTGNNLNFLFKSKNDRAGYFSGSF